MTGTHGTVWFVGAGPGDPDLITVKGRRLLEQAGVLLFAGSLVAAHAFGLPTRLAPLGGSLMILGWLLHAAAAARGR